MAENTVMDMVEKRVEEIGVEVLNENEKSYLRKLKFYRLQYGLTQEEAGKIIGVSARTYKNKESGKSDFCLEEIVDIIRFLKIKANQIL